MKAPQPFGEVERPDTFARVQREGKFFIYDEDFQLNNLSTCSVILGDYLVNKPNQIRRFPPLED